MTTLIVNPNQPITNVIHRIEALFPDTKVCLEFEDGTGSIVYLGDNLFTTKEHEDFNF